MTTTSTPPPTKAKSKQNPYLATVGKYAKEPLWDALQEEMQKQRDATNALADAPAQIGELGIVTTCLKMKNVP